MCMLGPHMDFMKTPTRRSLEHIEEVLMIPARICSQMKWQSTVKYLVLSQKIGFEEKYKVEWTSLSLCLKTQFLEANQRTSYVPDQKTDEPYQK